VYISYVAKAHLFTAVFSQLSIFTADYYVILSRWRV